MKAVFLGAFTALALVLITYGLSRRTCTIHAVHLAPLLFQEGPQKDSPPPIPRFPLFIVFQQNKEMFTNAFQSAQDAFPGQVVIIDNSDGSDGSLHATQEFEEAASYFHTITLLNFSQLMNMLAAMSAAWGYPYFGWMHSDGVVMVKPPQKGQSETTSMGAVVEAKLQKLHSWGVAFTNYDVLAFFNTEVVLEHRFDENYLQNYMADCDVYHRWRAAGYTTDKLPGIDEYLQVVHLGSVPQKSWREMTPAQREDTFPSLEKQKLLVGANHWKFGHAHTAFTASQAFRYDAALQYYRAKWGSAAFQYGCELGDESVKPVFDIAPSAAHAIRSTKGSPQKQRSAAAARRRAARSVGPGRRKQ